MLRLSATVIFVISLVVICFAQGRNPSVRVYGRVVDPNGAVITNVPIVLKSLGSRESLRTVTDEEGNFAFETVEPSKYEITTETLYFEKHVQTVSVEGREDTQL